MNVRENLLKVICVAMIRYFIYFDLYYSNHFAAKLYGCVVGYKIP